MHPCLTINEIQTGIFAYTAENRDLQPLTSLARCCKSFSKNALTFLWKFPPDVGVLIRVMPRNLWIEKKLGRTRKILKFTRPLVDIDFERLNYYGPMIRTLHLSQQVRSSAVQSGYIDIDPDIFAALRDFVVRKGRKHLLPNLRKAILYFGMDESFVRNSIPHLDCLLSPRLMALTLEHRRDQFELSNEICEVIASLFIRSCCNVVTLDVGYSAFLENIDNNDLSNLFLHLQKLQSIRGSINATKKETVRHLGSLPSLRCIQGLFLYEDADITSFATVDGRFQNIEKLQLCASGWDKVAAILDIMRCRFESLDIQLDGPGDDEEEIPTSHAFQDLTSTFTSNAFLAESLKTLTITDTREYELYAELMPSTFEPFLALRALQHLILKIGDLEHLNDDWLAEAALAWPDIRTLIISAVDNRFSLKGLIPLLKNCRKLTTIELHPTAIAFDLSLLPADGSALNNNITGIFSLHKAEADKMDPEAIFACLKAMFPNMTGVERADITFSGDFDSCDEDEGEYLEKWERLEKMFKGRIPHRR